MKLLPRVVLAFLAAFDTILRIKAFLLNGPGARGWTRRVVILLVPVFFVTCGGGNDVTGPSSTTPTNRLPAVAGSYSGTTTFTFPELNRTISCPTTTTVTQNGANVSIAPLQFSGQCTGLSVPIGSVTIDNAGSLGSESGTYTDASCGVYSYTVSGGFFGRDMRISMVANSRTCYNQNITINLTR